MAKEIKDKQHQNTFGLFVLALIITINIGCDQISKTIVRQRVDYYQNIEIIKSYVYLTKVENTGAFLSAGDNLPEFVKIIFLTILPVVVLAYGCYFLFTQNRLARTFQIGVCFLIGGGIGNIFDRIRFGSVTDFLHIDFVLFRTGIFNLADVSIMLGISILLFQSYLGYRFKHQTTKYSKGKLD